MVEMAGGGSRGQAGRGTVVDADAEERARQRLDLALLRRLHHRCELGLGGKTARGRGGKWRTVAKGAASRPLALSSCATDGVASGGGLWLARHEELGDLGAAAVALTGSTQWNVTRSLPWWMMRGVSSG